MQLAEVIEQVNKLRHEAKVFSLMEMIGRRIDTILFTDGWSGGTDGGSFVESGHANTPALPGLPSWASPEVMLAGVGGGGFLGFHLLLLSGREQNLGFLNRAFRRVASTTIGGAIGYGVSALL